MTDLVAAIGILALGLTISWVIFLSLWKCFNRIRLVRILGGRYAINRIDDPSGFPGLGEAIRSRILDELSFASRGARTLQTVDGPDGLVPIQVPPLSDQFKALSSLVNLLLRQDRFVVTVTALPPLAREAAIHVRLSRSTGRVLESRRFTEPINDSDDPSDAYIDAAMQAGSWLAFMLDKNSRSRFVKGHKRRTQLLGTESWLSYAWLCQGIRHASSPSDQIDWYHAALRVDHRNIGALIALGQRLTMYSDPSMRSTVDVGVDHLELALNQLSDRRDGMRRWLRWEYPHSCANPRWYQATYVLTGALLNYYSAFESSSSPCEAERLSEAVRLGTQLARAGGATQLTLASRWRALAIHRNRRAELQRLFREGGIELVGMLAGAKEFLEMQRGYLDDCEYDWKSQDRKELWKLLSKLDPDRPSMLPPARYLLCVQECGDTPGVSTVRSMDIATHYNRACFYACAGPDDYDNAMQELRHCITHISAEPSVPWGPYSDIRWTVLWANQDPSLQALRENRRREFDDLMRLANRRLHPQMAETDRMHVWRWQKFSDLMHQLGLPIHLAF
jgi:hypothetical protein